MVFSFSFFLLYILGGRTFLLRLSMKLLSCFSLAGGTFATEITNIGMNAIYDFQDFSFHGIEV